RVVDDGGPTLRIAIQPMDQQRRCPTRTVRPAGNGRTGHGQDARRGRRDAGRYRVRRYRTNLVLAGCQTTFVGKSIDGNGQRTSVRIFDEGETCDDTRFRVSVKSPTARAGLDANL